MIFGFNTDIRHEDTIYHVQSEAREGEHLLQTQVFVKGRCIGKRAVPYGSSAEEGKNPQSNNQDKDKDKDREKMLREQHREVLDAIRAGKLDSIFDKRDTPETLAAVKELDLEWTNAGSVHASGALTMHLRATESWDNLGCKNCSNEPDNQWRTPALIRRNSRRARRNPRHEARPRSHRTQ